MKLKINEEGTIVLSEEGLPIWILDEDGDKEVAYDVQKLVKDLTNANSESAGRRKKIEELESKTKLYEGLDIEEAKKALETVKSYSDKQLLDAGQVDEIKRAAEDSYKAKMDELQKDLASKIGDRDIIIKKKETQINDLLIKGAFTSSKFLVEKTIMPSDLAYSHFGKNFKVEETEHGLRTIATYDDGKTVFSDIDPGSPAQPEEAIEKIINRYPYKDSILKGAGGSGTGSFAPGSKDIDTPITPAEGLYGKTMNK